LAAWKQAAGLYEVAVASPVYFIPEGFRRPAPVLASVRLKIMDENGQSLPASISIEETASRSHIKSFHANDSVSLEIPATSSIVIKSPGYDEARRDIYMDSPIYAYCRDNNDFYSPRAFQDLEEMLGNIRFNIKLKKSNP
jgi:hypothetical protein